MGLPLGIVLAGVPEHQVYLVDTNSKAVDLVNRGIISFVEKGGEEELQKVVGKSLWATTEKSIVSECEVIIFVTGTPVDEHMNPRINDVTDVINSYLDYFVDDQLIVLRSTLFPGMTDMLHNYIKERKQTISLAFCPERVTQGNGIEEVKSLPQIVSAVEESACNRAVELFKTITENVIYLTPLEAELTKLFANSWRYIQFAIANQLYMIAETYGVKFMKIHHALTYKYPRAADFPKSGFAAGPCLFKDTMQLSAFHKNNFFLGHAAMLINESMPNFVVDQLEEKLGNLKGKTIGILGMAFKANNDDTRESLSYKLKKILQGRMCKVLDTDVYQHTSVRLENVIEESDALILGVPHREYLSLDLKHKIVVDCWGVWEKGYDEQNPSLAPSKIDKKSAA